MLWLFWMTFMLFRDILHQSNKFPIPATPNYFWWKGKIHTIFLYKILLFNFFKAKLILKNGANWYISWCSCRNFSGKTDRDCLGSTKLTLSVLLKASNKDEIFMNELQEVTLIFTLALWRSQPVSSSFTSLTRLFKGDFPAVNMPHIL